jgi:hypothetical protein
LRHLVAEGTASAEVVAAVHAVASALDPEALGLKDATPVTGMHELGCGLGRRPPARASAARPGHPAASEREGVVARLT